jgi:hypothetical protein
MTQSSHLEIIYEWRTRSGRAATVDETDDGDEK